jgi:hypothetical protein
MLTKPDTTPVHRSDGTEGKQHRATVLLGDWHSEYTGEWPKRYGGWPNDWAQVRGIDVFLLQEVHELLSGEELSESTLRLLIPMEENEGYDEISQFSTLWVIEGTPDGHEMAFIQLLGWLDVQPSGDDDFFDYWPNTMDMVWQYASDLDEWETKRRDFDDDVKIVTRRKRVRALVSKVWEGAQADIRHEWLGHAWSKHLEVSE